jgi:hypothetical protein
LHVDNNWESVTNIQVVPSTVQGGNIVYTIDTKTETEVQSIQVSFNQETKEMTVVDLVTESVEQIVFAPEESIVVVDIEKNVEEVNTYIEAIKTYQTTETQQVKKVVKVEKEVHSFYEKVYTEVIDENE